MLANAGQLGLDWERLSLSGYLEALEAHNEANSGGKNTPDASQLERLNRFNRAHGVH